MRLRRAKRDVLKRAGGTYDAAEVARLLCVSDDEVRQRLRDGRLIALYDQADTPRFPRVQFTDDGVLPGLELVLAAMHVRGAWMRLQLFLDDDVIGALRDGRTGDAVMAADSYLSGPPRGE